MATKTRVAHRNCLACQRHPIRIRIAQAKSSRHLRNCVSYANVSACKWIVVNCICFDGIVLYGLIGSGYGLRGCEQDRNGDERPSVKFIEPKYKTIIPIKNSMTRYLAHHWIYFGKYAPFECHIKCATGTQYRANKSVDIVDGLCSNNERPFLQHTFPSKMN